MKFKKGLFPFLLSFLCVLNLGGCNTIGPQGPQGPQGIPGTNGENGITPHIGENGNWWIGDQDTGISAAGEAGQDGKDGTSLHTGHGVPSYTLGELGDSYIDLDSWDFYVKKESGWVSVGNIKDSEDSGGEIDYCIVNFDTLGGTKINPVFVEKGTKIQKPTDPSIFAGEFVTWKYIDENYNEEYEWFFSRDVVYEDMTLTAEYVMAENTISISHCVDIDNPYSDYDRRFVELLETETGDDYFKTFKYVETQYNYDISYAAQQLFYSSYKMPNIIMAYGFVMEGETMLFNTPEEGSYQEKEMYAYLNPLPKDTRSYLYTKHLDVYNQLSYNQNNYFLPLYSYEGRYYISDSVYYNGTYYYFMALPNPNIYERHIDEYDSLRLEVCLEILESIYRFFN